MSEQKIRIVSKPGRCATEAEKGQGVIIHAVLSEVSVFDGYVPAVCNTKPSGRLGWNDYTGSQGMVPMSKLPAINCTKCLKILGK